MAIFTYDHLAGGLPDGVPSFLGGNVNAVEAGGTDIIRTFGNSFVGLCQSASCTIQEASSSAPITFAAQAGEFLQNVTLNFREGSGFELPVSMFVTGIDHTGALFSGIFNASSAGQNILSASLSQIVQNPAGLFQSFSVQDPTPASLEVSSLAADIVTLPSASVNGPGTFALVGSAVAAGIIVGVANRFNNLANERAGTDYSLMDRIAQGATWVANTAKRFLGFDRSEPAPVIS